MLLRELVGIALNISHFFNVIRVDVLPIRNVLLVLLVAGQVRLLVRVHLCLLSCSFAQRSSTIRVRKRAKSICSLGTIPAIDIVGAFEDMTLVTALVVAVAATCERSTNRSRRRDVNVRIAAYIVRAVAAKEMGARGGVRVRGRMAEVAIVAFRASGLEKHWAHSDFVRVVGEVAHGATRAVTYSIR